jgi:molybdopterin converting factor small subunit
MKKMFKIIAFVVLITITALTLTSGISKDKIRDGGDKDLVEELYREAIKQNDNLEAIEDDIEKFYKSKTEALEKYNSFLAYNNRYYSDARSKVAAISEAATKQKAYDLISKSEANYHAKIARWQQATSVLIASEKELDELHGLLKIMTTESMIQKFQGSSFPDDGKLKEANMELQKVIERIKAITK